MTSTTGHVATSHGAPEGAGFGSLNGVMLLFTSPYAVLAGWSWRKDHAHHKEPKEISGTRGSFGNGIL